MSKFVTIIAACQNVYVDITEYVLEKERLLECCYQEIRVYPHSRFIENPTNLARYLGSSVGVNFLRLFAYKIN